MAGQLNARKGFTDVDAQPDPGFLVAGMDATAQWPAVQRLRAWERERLTVEPGHQVLDVGCGAGDVIIALAGVVGDEGKAVGIDASDEMLSAASQRASAAGVAVSFQRGDATALALPDDTFDAVRSERTMQWVADPAKAVAELARVARPGGRVCVIDTDWRTLIVDHPSPENAERFFDALRQVRGDQLTVGGRLTNLVRDAGLADIEVTAETHMWLAWDPDESPSLPGFFPLRMVAADLVAQGLIAKDVATTTVDEFEAAARRDRFFVALTMFAVAGRVPSA